MNHPSRQSGSAFFLILFAIAAFGALSYIVFKDSRGSEGALGSEKAKLAAEEIINNLAPGESYQAPDGSWKKR